MHIWHRYIVADNVRVFTDYGTQGVAVPAVLSRALPMVSNSDGTTVRSGVVTLSHPRVVVLQVGVHLGADALPVGVCHARE